MLSEPSSRCVDGLSFARRIVFQLIPADAAEHEVARLGMAEVNAADAGRRCHRAAIGQIDTDALRCEQIELYRLAVVLCSADMRERVVDASFADFQHEWLDAVTLRDRLVVMARVYASLPSLEGKLPRLTDTNGCFKFL